MTVYCGIDWAESHHDVALVDQGGQLLAKCRIGDDAAGYRLLLDLLADHGDTPEEPIPIAIETSRGLLVAALRTGSRKVFAINPLAAARYRDRHGVSRKKSDPGDALVLAHILRTDMAMHRPLPADSDHARAVSVLARAQQDAVWSRQQLVTAPRSTTRHLLPPSSSLVRRATLLPVVPVIVQPWLLAIVVFRTAALWSDTVVGQDPGVLSRAVPSQTIWSVATGRDLRRPEDLRRRVGGNLN